MKKKLIILTCLMMSVLMAACSTASTNPQTPGQPEQSEQPSQKEGIITVEDMKGTAEIPAEPKRIIDVSGSADELIALGVPFIASANTSMFDGVTVPDYLKDYFTDNNVEVVGNYSGASGDLNLEKIAELKPDLIIMNIRHDKVYEQLKAIAPTVMLSDDINFVDWQGRFSQLGKWFGKEAAVADWIKAYDKKAEELGARIKEKVGDETFAVLEANSVHFGSYYVYRTGGPGDLIFGAMKLPPSAGVPEGVWGEVVDAEYFSKIDADHIFFFSDDGKVGDTADSPTWQNLKAVKDGNVYCGVNDLQYNMAYTPNGKLLYMEKLANAVINHTDVE